MTRRPLVRRVGLPFWQTRTTLLVTALIGLAGVAAAARSGAAESATASVLEVVQVTAKRRATSTLDTPTPVIVIGPEDMAAAAPLTVADYLHGEPGTFVQQTTPGQGIVIVRGLKGSEVLHLVDGFRLNNAIFRNAPNQYLALVDSWNLERLEAARGPMSALYGGDAMGGVIQFLTPNPEFTGSEIGARATVRLQMQSANSSTAVHGEGELGTSTWTTQGGFTWQDAGRLRTGGGDTLPFTDFQAYGAHGKWILRPDPDQTVVAQAQYMRQPETARHDVLVPGFGQSELTLAEFLYRPQERRFLQARWMSERASAFADSIDVQLGLQQMIDDRVSRDLGAPYRDLEQNSSSLAGLAADFGLALAASHHLSYGLELYHDRVESTRQRVDVATEVSSARPGRFPDGSTMAWLGIYFADEWRLHERLELNLGARYSIYDIDVTRNAEGVGAELAPDDLSGHLGLLIRASDNLRLIASAGRAFRPPNIFDLGTFGPRGDRFSLPNPDLAPETVTSVELGLKFESERVRAELMAFRSRYDDKITQVLTGAIDPQGRAIVQSRNATELDLEGAEAGAFWQLGSAFSVYTTASWVWGQEQYGGDSYPADRIPPLFGKLVARYSLQPHWDLEAALNWADEQDRLSPRDRIDPRIDPGGTAGWHTIDLRADRQLTERLRVSFGLENLFDRRYREHGSGFDAPGRNAVLILNSQF